MEKLSVKMTLARFLVRLGVSADILTFSGLALSFTSAAWIAQGRWSDAAAALLASGSLDMLDGAVARASGKASVFGGILDSSLDRYGDGAVLGGILIYSAQTGRMSWLLPAVSALIGSFSVSYVRARAECEMDDCRVGFWERAERLVFIALALFFNNLGPALWVLAVGTHWTVFQRLACARSRARDAAKPLPFYLRSARRDSAPYFLKVTALIALLLFLPR